MNHQTTASRVERHSWTGLLAAGAAALFLAGCASPSYTITDEGRARAASDGRAASASDFPDAASARWKQGAFPNIENLRKMRTGMGKDQVRELLGWPHFNEGIGGVREWNYLFHFRTGPGPEFVTCQYMVRFNADVLSNGMYWKDPACADRIATALPAVVQVAAPMAAPAPAPVPPPPAPRLTLSADALFRFDGSDARDLLPGAHPQIDALAAEIRRTYRRVDSITVSGHTDRLGSTAYNQRLSLARANTVRDILVNNGLPRAQFRTVGMGESRPVSNCPGGDRRTPELIACLQPDRRVDVEVTGER